MQSTARRLTLLMTVGLILNGCQPTGFIAAHVAMSARAATEARPDELLRYEIEVTTLDNINLLFKGTTECPHNVSFQGGGVYRTKTPYSTLEANGQTWILYGINCNNEFKDKKTIDYKLYKIIDDEIAKMYFVSPDGNATVEITKFEHEYHSSSDEANNRFNSYDDGPFIYQKVFDISLDRLIANERSPNVVYVGTNICSQLNSDAISIDESDIKIASIIRDSFMAEEGHLDYVKNEKAWTLRRGRSLSIPMDTVKPEPWENTSRLPDGCLRLLVGGKIYFVNKNTTSSLLYIRSEHAAIRLQRVHNAREIYGHWESCIKPSGMPEVPSELVRRYRASPQKPYIYVKMKADGSYWCNRNYGFIGGGGFNRKL